MTQQSSINGDALEYIVTNTIKDHFDGAELSSKTVEFQRRDKEKFDLLLDSQRNYYQVSSKKVVCWLKEQLNNRRIKKIRRLSDDAGSKGNPTDISIHLNDGTVINLSLKHNSLSLKHQRLPSLYKQISISDTKAEEEYRASLKKTSNIFFDNVMKVNKSIRTFNESDAQVGLRDKLLYLPMMSIYINELKKYSSDCNATKNYFKFLVGEIDYKQIKIDSKSVTITHFDKIELPESFEVERKNDSTYKLKFSNEFSFNLRIHTASRRIESCSKSCCEMKIDTTFIDSKFKAQIL